MVAIDVKALFLAHCSHLPTNSALSLLWFSLRRERVLPRFENLLQRLKPQPLCLQSSDHCAFLCWKRRQRLLQKQKITCQSSNPQPNLHHLKIICLPMKFIISYGICGSNWMSWWKNCSCKTLQTPFQPIRVVPGMPFQFGHLGEEGPISQTPFKLDVSLI